MNNWWMDNLNPNGLSQGDIVADIPFGISVFPPSALSKQSGKGGTQIWQQCKLENADHFLFKGQRTNAIVVSHSCDLDKKEVKARVLVAPIRRLETLTEEARELVLMQKRISLMPLPAIPTLDSHYADLRLITPIDRQFLTDVSRIASMTDSGVERLQAQLAAFFLRKTLPIQS